MQIDTSAARARDGATYRIDHAQHAAAFAHDFLDGRERVERLAGLAHRDVERIRLDDWVAVSELRGRLGVGRHTGKLLDELCPNTTGDIGRAATENLDAADFQELARGHFQPTQMGCMEPALQATAQSAPNRIRLLVNLLMH